MPEHYVVGSDMGSSGCKTVVINEKGAVVSQAQKGYTTSYPHPGWVEQNPDNWYESFCHTVHLALERGNIDINKVLCIGIVGVTHNFVLLDKNDHPLQPSILLFDTRSSAQVDKILTDWGPEINNKTFNEVSTIWSWPQLLWIRENKKDIWSSINRILFQKDYVRHHLGASPVTDHIDAQGSLLFNAIKKEWIIPFCDDLGLKQEWLPEIVSPFDVVTKVTEQGSRDTGLAEGTPVITGTTDTVAEVCGAGANFPGHAIVKLASVGRVAVVTNKPLIKPNMCNYQHVFDNQWYPGFGTKSAATSYSWLQKLLWPNKDTANSYQEMDEQAEKIKPGCNGLLFLPYLMGEWAPYWNDSLSGGLIGLRIQHTQSHVIRAVLEGVAFSLKPALLDLEKKGGKIKELSLIGQGSNSKLWCQIVTDIIGRRIVIPENTSAAYGSALIAAMGIDFIEKSAEKLRSIIPVRHSLEPIPENKLLYDSLFNIYKDSSETMRSISMRLGDYNS